MSLLKKILVYWYQQSEAHLPKRGSRLIKNRLYKKYRRTLNNYVISHYKASYVELDVGKMYLDEKDSCQLSLRKYPQMELNFLKSQIQKGDTVVELGANIGFHTLYLRKLIGDTGKLFSFEPLPELFEILKKNVKINGYQNITIEQKAVSNKTGKSRLYLSYETTDNRIYDSYDGRDSIEIETITLDDYFQNFDGKIDFVYSDVQGADYAAVQGMSSIIEKLPNIKILAEFSPFMLEKFDSKPSDFLQILLDKGFNLYDLNIYKKSITPVEVESFLDEYAAEKITGTELFCTKEALTEEQRKIK